MLAHIYSVICVGNRSIFLFRFLRTFLIQELSFFLSVFFISYWTLVVQLSRNIKTSEKQTKSINSMWIDTSSKSVILRLQTKRCNAIHRKRSSKKERRVDALALRAEERRDKLRKATGRSKYPSIRRYLNGETRLEKLQSSIRQSITYGREPGELKHLSSRRKRKKHRFPK